MADGRTRRVVIVGGGFAGLSLAGTLASAGLPVTLFEASKLGHGASTRNQGWLHSGGWFAHDDVELARHCHASLERTLRFCPEAVEPDHDGMAYVLTNEETHVAEHTAAWEAAGIPYREAATHEVTAALPGFDASRCRTAFLLPDRSVRQVVLIERLAAVAQRAGAELRTETAIAHIACEDGVVTGVETGTGEDVAAGIVVLAGGPENLPLLDLLCADQIGSQSDDRYIVLKTHLVSRQPPLGSLPFCILDDRGFNHLPHAKASVFGLHAWTPLAGAGSTDDETVTAITDRIHDYFPDHDHDAHEHRSWSGTMVQALDVAQIVPGGVPLPTVVDHADDTPALAGLVSIHPGRATLWSHTAAEAATLITGKLEHDTPATSTPPWVD